jgi:hypothetical protein
MTGFLASGKSLANYVDGAEVLARQRFVHNKDQRTSITVSIVKVAASQKRNSKRFEKARGNPVYQRRLVLCAGVIRGVGGLER